MTAGAPGAPGAPGAADGTIDAADVARWRADTPGVAKRHHLNNAGASLQPRVVTDAVRGHLDLESEIGGYEAAAAAQARIDDAYRAIGALVRVPPGNIAVTSSATASYAVALSAFDFTPGDTIVTTRADYLSNRIMFESLGARRGVRVVEAADLPAGGVDPDSVRTLIRTERPQLVAVTWIPTFGGLVQRVADVGAACAVAGVPFLVDACQAVGQVDVDLAAVRCDFLAATARKFLRGPRGIGFLAVSDAMLERRRFPLFVDMRGASWTGPGGMVLADGARRFEQWEQPHALVLGMGAAVRYALQVGVPRAAARAHALAADVRRRLAALPGVRSLDRGETLSAIAAFACPGPDAAMIVRALRERGVNTSAQSLDENAFALGHLGATSLLRVSPHYYNDASDLDAVEVALGEVLSG
ncbi:MAG TPA: aminotransferase class V-fold PLP-dependent enzyme [Gemmatimonadaceae bacterium]|nr:aminotransferase class V-fold PLP-dependent enzyme [Gemmatimonadaceae bacterium]